MSKEKEVRFSDHTILSTPNPIHSSSLLQGKNLRKLTDLDDIPQRLSDSDNSLGILSIKSGDFPIPDRTSDASAYLSEQKEMAHSIMKNYDLRRLELTSLPSRFLRPSDISDISGNELIHSESTISESDLIVPGDSSTPRESMLSNVEFVMKAPRQSLGQAVSSLATSIKSPNFDMNRLTNLFNHTKGPENSFQCGEEALAKFKADEISCRYRTDIPTDFKEFSVGYDDHQISIGGFFKERSDDLPRLFARSPKKSQPPVPLIDTTSNKNSEYEVGEKSLNLSDIQHLVADQSTNVALEVLLKPKTRPKSKPVGKPAVVELEKSEELQEEEEDTKENISPECHVKSILSSRSSSSLSSLPDGKLPIATTKTEIIWGCIKPGKSSSNDFVVRNRSSSRLGIQCTVSNPSFRLNKEGSELNFSSVMKIVLHPYESRAVTVFFAPTTLGASVDCLNFTSTDPNHKQTVKQFIKLYGYGGHGKMVIHKIIKDTTDKFLLSLGNIDDQRELKQNFTVKNRGSLSVFAYMEFISNGLYSFSKLHISPKSVVLLPGEEREVTVSFSLLKKDYSFIKTKINNCVINIGKLQVIHGTEVDRGRLRKVSLKAQEKKKDVSCFVLNLIEKFPGEIIPNDLKHFRESISSMEEILKLLNNEEITITFEQCLDSSVSSQLQDETVIYQSLCENTNLDVLESTSYRETCHIEPNRIILTPPGKIKDMIFLSNNNKKKLYFEVSSSPEGLHLKPNEGTINPGETLIIDLMYTKKCNDKSMFKVRILVDNESFEVDVKVLFVTKALC